MADLTLETTLGWVETTPTPIKPAPKVDGNEKPTEEKVETPKNTNPTQYKNVDTEVEARKTCNFECTSPVGSYRVFCYCVSK